MVLIYDFIADNPLLRKTIVTKWWYRGTIDVLNPARGITVAGSKLGARATVSGYRVKEWVVSLLSAGTAFHLHDSRQGVWHNRSW
jgi:hypothetical protein